MLGEGPAQRFWVDAGLHGLVILGVEGRGLDYGMSQYLCTVAMNIPLMDRGGLRGLRQFEGRTVVKPVARPYGLDRRAVGETVVWGPGGWSPVRFFHVHRLVGSFAAQSMWVKPW